MKIEELAKLLGKTRMEVEDMLKKDEIIELNLSEKRAKQKDSDNLKIFEHV